MPKMHQKSRIEAMLQLANIKSDNKAEALRDYFVLGYSQIQAAKLNDISQPTLAAAIKRIQEKFTLVVAAADCHPRNRA